jgi:hypothetical protein
VPKGKKEKAIDHKHHMKLQREKELKRKERRDVARACSLVFQINSVSLNGIVEH